MLCWSIVSRRRRSQTRAPAPTDDDDDSFDYGEFDYKEESLWEATEEEEEQWGDGSELADPE
jgi:hypothetical protein